jgi:hypothetical protein
LAMPHLRLKRGRDCAASFVNVRIAALPSDRWL